MVLATSSSPKAPADRRRAAAHPGWIKEVFEREGWNLSLPHCVLDNKGQWVLGNFRMAELLGYRQMPSFPVAAREVAERWPFFNAQQSSVAMLSALQKGNAAPELMAEAGLKTFRLHLRTVKAGRESLRLLVAESLRRGDLLQDQKAKQTLFLSLSHEIRTSVSALKGYFDMLPASAGTAEVSERMKHAVGRLENVVKRLNDFKSALEDE